MSKRRLRDSRIVCCMVVFTFRCPDTGLNVQGWIAHDPTDKADAYEPVICTACTRTHLVNPKTRKVLGADKK